MNLFFTADIKLNSKHSALFNHIALDIRKSFTDLIESISRQNPKSIDWWVSSPASRNTFASPLFSYCCFLVLLQELIRANEPINEIITDSKAFKKIIKNYLADHGLSNRVILARMSIKRSLKELVRPIYIMFGLPLNYLLLFFISRQMWSFHKLSLLHPLTLIDTFVMPGYIEKDRYYPGILDAISEGEKQHVWFVPHLYGFRPWQFLQVLRQLSKSKRNFILKDCFLKFKDYWCLWSYMFRVRKLQIKPNPFCGVDISCLVREELMGFRSIGSSYVPLLNYRFAKRLKEVGVKLRLIIDWFENQNINKGWNAGFRNFFPDVKTIGYQGFVPTKHFLCLYPAEEERKSNVLPHTVYVIGRGMVQTAKEFCSSLDVKVAPAFRFQHVWFKKEYFPEPNIFTILVALPNIIKEVLHILELLDWDIKNKGIRFLIKNHPGTPKNKIKAAYGSTWPEQFEFVDGEFGEFIEKSNLLISAASSTCMETLAKGIPVIIVGSRTGLTHNLIPESLNSDIWRLCYNSQEVADAIQFYQNRTPEKIFKHEKTGKKIREEYFEPVTKDGVRRFLGL
jgi:hypothetical protein